MKIDKKQFKEILETVRPGLANNDVIDQASSFVFLEDKVMTYNDSVSVSYPMEFDFVGAVDADKLYKLITNMKGKEVEIVAEEGELLVKCGRGRAGIRLQEEIQIPIIEDIGRWKLLPEGFVDCLRFACPVCSKDMSRIVFTGVKIQSGYMIASDGFRILEQEIPEIKLRSFILPSSSCEVVCSSKPIKIGQSKGWVHFLNEEGVVISSRTIPERDGLKYPNVSELFLEWDSEFEVILPAKVLDTVMRARIISKTEFEMDEKITLRLQSGKATVEAVNTDGWYEEKGRCDYKGEEVEIIITPILFEHIFKKKQTFILGKGKAQFQDNGWRYLIQTS